MITVADRGWGWQITENTKKKKWYEKYKFFLKRSDCTKEREVSEG
jgi:hypothetical protein